MRKYCLHSTIYPTPVESDSWLLRHTLLQFFHINGSNLYGVSCSIHQYIYKYWKYYALDILVYGHIPVAELSDPDFMFKLLICFNSILFIIKSMKQHHITVYCCHIYVRKHSWSTWHNSRQVVKNTHMIVVKFFGTLIISNFAHRVRPYYHFYMILFQICIKHYYTIVLKISTIKNI